MKKIFIVIIFLISLFSFSEAGVREQKKFNTEREQIYYHMDNIKDYAEYLKFFNKCSLHFPDFENYNEILSDMEEIKIGVSDSLLYITKSLSFRDTDKLTIKLLNEYAEVYPEIILIFLEEKSELIHAMNNNYISKTLNTLRFDEYDYEERLLNINISKFINKFVKNRWEFAYSEFKNTENKDIFKERKNRINKFLYWYDRIRLVFDYKNTIFSKGFKEFGYKNYNQARYYFSESKENEKNIFLKNGGSNWKGFSENEIEYYKESIESFINCIKEEKEYYRLNSLFNIIYFYRNTMKDDKNSISESIEVFKTIREEAPSDYEQMMADFEIIKSYVKSGDLVVSIEEKEHFYKIALSSCDDFYIKWIKGKKTEDSSRIVSLKYDIYEKLFIAYFKLNDEKKILSYLEQSYNFMLKILNEFDLYSINNDPIEDKMLFLKQRVYNCDDIVVQASVCFKDNKEMIKVIESVVEKLDKFFDEIVKTINYLDDTDDGIELIESIGYIVDYAIDFNKYYFKNENKTNIFVNQYIKYISYIIDNFHNYYDYYYNMGNVASVLIKIDRFNEAEVLLNDVKNNATDKYYRLSASMTLTSLFYVTGRIKESIKEGNEFLTKYGPDYIVEVDSTSFIPYVKALINEFKNTGIKEYIEQADIISEYIIPSNDDNDFGFGEYVNKTRFLIKSDINILNGNIIQAKENLNSVLNTKDNFGKSEAYNKLAEIEYINLNYEKSQEYIKSSVKYNNEIHYFSYKFFGTLYTYPMFGEDLTSDCAVIDALNFVKDKLIIVRISPVIEDLKPGESIELKADLVYPDKTLVSKEFIKDLEWEWRWTEKNDVCDFEIKRNLTEKNKVTFKLIKGDYTEPIITAKANIELNINERKSRMVERKLSLEADNQVPIMIVNEDDRRIKNIPMIDASNLTGIYLGELN
ncbi:MAG: hypothetical protein M0R46_18005, partial [Candidatus Muirbacterium halophilum]|nr:hypothetical protein [Candidatus Muirbacterium halophilum]MCK9477812.1 hypothetical protein [Candidatus Muirbacterium halophilum]